jgi:hypothetical protein
MYLRHSAPAAGEVVLTAIGLYHLQRRLERWDYERHRRD